MNPRPLLLASLALFSALGSSAFAQTNTFPASGNVGIGTTGPTAKLTLFGPGGSASASGIEWFSSGNATGYHGWGGRAYVDVPSGGWATAPFVFAVPDGSGNEIKTLTLLNGRIGVGTTSPAFKLDVAGDIRSTSNLVEKKVVFTPTAVGWYRIVSGLGGAGMGQAGGTIRTMGTYDGGTTALEFIYNIRGWGQGASVTLVKNTGVNGNIIDQARVSTDGGGTMYLDLHISTATAPSPITIYGYGPDMPAFVSSPVVGATAGTSNVRVLPVGYSVGGYDDFRTTGNVVTYSSDGSTPQGYIYHGTSGQAAFGNGVVNGETWITRTGGAGSIKLGDYDLNTAYLTITGGNGNVGIGTTNPTHKLAVNGTIKAKEIIVETTGWSDYVFVDGYTLAPLTEVEAHIKEYKHLPGIPSAAQVAEQGVSIGDMQARLLAKIEELTLHQIAQEKRAALQDARASEQNKEIAELRAQVSQLSSKR
jgi:hypothetical protein